MPTRLTCREKAAIRLLACSRCGARPPFERGMFCHVHRPHRGADGGEYVHGNALPLCPTCHREVDREVLLVAARKGGRRIVEIRPNHMREIAVLGHTARDERKRLRGLTPAELAHNRQNGVLYGRLTVAKANAASVRRMREEGLTEAQLEHRRVWAKRAAGIRWARVRARKAGHAI